MNPLRAAVDRNVILSGGEAGDEGRIVDQHQHRGDRTFVSAFGFAQCDVYVSVWLACAVLFTSCQCGTDVEQKFFSCVDSAQCIDGFTCEPRSHVCVRATDAGAAGGGGAVALGGGAAGVGGGSETGGGGVDPIGGGSATGGGIEMPMDAGCISAGAESCTNGIDDDCDTLRDCDDPDCSGETCGPNGSTCTGTRCTCMSDGGATSLVELSCSDAIDNNCNGQIDCEESTCDTQPCGANNRICHGLTCTCLASGMPPAAVETSCTNGIDDNCNGQIDCADPSCMGQACGTGRACQNGGCVCSPPGGNGQAAETLCADGVDNDCDGLIDCQDPGCLGLECGTNTICLTTQPASCGCPLVSNSMGLGGGGRSSIVELANTPRVLLHVSTNFSTSGQLVYTECTANCLASNSQWSSPVPFDDTPGGSQIRPSLRALGSGLASFRRSGGLNSPAVYSECAGPTCRTPGDWSSANIDIASGSAGAMDLNTGGLRAVVYERPDAGAEYAECTGNCLQAGSWSKVGFPVDPLGASVVVSATGSTVMRRAFVFGTAAPAHMLYGECTANCGSAASWSTLSIDQGAIPDLVLDRQGLPRVFFNPGGSGAGGASVARCTVRPCTSLSNWVTVPVVPAGVYASAFVAPDGRTGVATSATSGSLVIATENAAGTAYDVEPQNDCSGQTLVLQYPSLYLEPGDRFRLVGGSGFFPIFDMRYSVQLP